MPEPLTLWHYTCDHGLDAIRADAMFLRPQYRGMLWLTDLDAPMRDALGLTSRILDCDRTAHRLRALETFAAVHWVNYRREADPGWVADLETAPGAMPMHWWVSSLPIPAVLDPTRP